MHAPLRGEFEYDLTKTPISSSHFKSVQGRRAAKKNKSSWSCLKWPGWDGSVYVVLLWGICMMNKIHGYSVFQSRWIWLLAKLNPACWLFPSLRGIFRSNVSGIRNHHRQRNHPRKHKLLMQNEVLGTQISGISLHRKTGGGERPVVGMLGFPRDSWWREPMGHIVT